LIDQFTPTLCGYDPFGHFLEPIEFVDRFNRGTDRFVWLSESNLAETAQDRSRLGDLSLLETLAVNELVIRRFFQRGHRFKALSKMPDRLFAQPKARLNELHLYG
jgi:hypothetical protein